MFFFDYVYLCIYQFYSAYNEKGAALTAASLTGGFQTINVLTIIMLSFTVNGHKALVSKTVGILLFMGFQIFSYLRYTYQQRFAVDVLQSKRFSQRGLFRHRMTLVVVLYVIISLSSFFGIAFYSGTLK
jgi:hypothetical protein